MKVSCLENTFEPNELKEIEKLTNVLIQGEEVLFVDKQSRVRPGGSLATPNTVFATNHRILIRNPSALELRNNVEDYPYSGITGVSLKKGMLSSMVRIVVPGARDGFLLWKKDTAELAVLPNARAKLLNKIIREGLVRVREKPETA
jgi:hypothetical protein